MFQSRILRIYVNAIYFLTYFETLLFLFLDVGILLIYLKSSINDFLLAIFSVLRQFKLSLSPNFENHENFYAMHILHILSTEQGLNRPALMDLELFLRLIKHCISIFLLLPFSL